MRQFGQIVSGLGITLMCSVGWAEAQGTRTPTPAADLIWAGQGDIAATFGRNSSSSGGAELGLRLTDEWEAFLEIGRMANVTSTDLEDRARFIGNAIGATANPIQHATYFDIGGRYHLDRFKLWRLPPTWHPFVLGGLGFARTSTETTFSRDGVDITGQLADIYGVQLGLDLEGHVTKALLTIGGGVTRPFKNRYFVEGTYRYGRIFARSGTIDDDHGVNTQRVQLGVGLRF